MVMRMKRTYAWWWMLASLFVGCGEQDPKPDSGTPDSPEPTETGDTVADSPRDTVDSRAPDTQESCAPGETGETGDTAPDGPLDVRNLSEAHGMLVGSQTSGFFGQDVSFVGDVNGDGYNDVLATSRYSALSHGGGTAFLFHGPIAGEVMTADADATLQGEVVKGYAYQTCAVGSLLGGSHAGFGIVSGAGHGGEDGGSVYLFSGPLSGDYVIQEADAVLIGQSGPGSAHKCRGQADLTGDGHVDLMANDRDAGSTLDGAGLVTIVPGPVVGTMQLSDAAVATITGDVEDAKAIGYVVHGDADGDGLGEVLVSVYAFADSADEDAGAVGLFVPPLAGSLELGDADRIFVGSGPGQMVWGRGAGDVNGDGYGDLGFYSSNDAHDADYAGTTYLVLGPASGGGEVDLLAEATIRGTVRMQQAGVYAEPLGDLDHDGFDELVLGGKGEDGMGAMRLFRGPLSGEFDTDDADVVLVDDLNWQDNYSHSMVAGSDVTGDGVPDLAFSTEIAIMNQGGEGVVFLVSGAEL
jgi:hypothetical protein